MGQPKKEEAYCDSQEAIWWVRWRTLAKMLTIYQPKRKVIENARVSKGERIMFEMLGFIFVTGLALGFFVLFGLFIWAIIKFMKDE